MGPRELPPCDWAPALQALPCMDWAVNSGPLAIMLTAAHPHDREAVDEAALTASMLDVSSCW